MFAKKYMFLAVTALLLLAGGCGNNKAAEEEADIIAAQMEGREAARIFVGKEWKDTTELQKLLLEARSRRTKYDTIGKSKAAAAYDSAFVSTVRTVRPDIARHIGKQ